jgi:hypothetical protein
MAVVMVFAAQWVISNSLVALFDVQKRYPYQAIMLHDLVGAELATGNHYIPIRYRSDHYSPEAVEKTYNPRFLQPLIYRSPHVDHPPYKLEELDKQYVDELTRSWRMMIMDQPVAYLSRRWTVFAPFLGPSGDYVLLRSQSLKEDRFGTALPGKDWAFEQANAVIHYFLRYTSIFSGFFWVVVLQIIAVMGFIHRRRHLGYFAAAAFGVSGLLYMLPYFFVAPGSTFRFIHWSTMSGTIGATLFVGMLIKECSTALEGWRAERETRPAEPSP